MQFSRIYNEKPFDSRHDIAVSMVFSMFNPSGACSGGLTVAFYEDSLISPFGGGIAGSLGYAPYTNPSLGLSYEGLGGAHVGVGLDITGEFSKRGNGRTTGDFKINPNTIVFRDSQSNNYNFLSYSENLTNFDINLGQNSTSESNAKDISIRIILSEQGRKIKVQKIINQDEYVTIAEQSFLEQKETAYRVVCTFVSPDNTTKCKIKQFNVYGFSNDFALNRDAEIDSSLPICYQDIKKVPFNTGQSRKIFLGSNNLFVEETNNLNFSNYILTRSETDPYDYRQTINYDPITTPLTTSEIFQNTDNNNILITKNTNNSNLSIYRNLGRRIVKEYSITNDSSPGFGNSSSIDGNILFVSTVSAVKMYKRSGYDWNYTSTVQNLSSQQPYNISFKNNNGIVSYYDGSVQIFENDGYDNYSSVYFLSAIGSTSEGFGNCIDISENFAVVGAPYKDSYYTDEGAVYVFSKTASWNFTEILSGGEIPEAYFGNSVSLFGGVLAVGVPRKSVALNARAGVVNIYDLGTTGSSILRSIYTPINLAPNVNMGTEVHLKNSILAARTYDSVAVFNLSCSPIFIPPSIVPPCAIQLISNITFGFIKKIDQTGYVLTIQCPKPPLTPLSSLCALVTILTGYPIYSVNGFDVLSPIFCPITGINIGF